MPRFNGEVVIVTGGNSGIGAASAKLFASEGARVVIAACNQERGEQVVHEIAEAGGEAAFIQTDVSQEEQVQACVQATLDRYGSIGIVFNNAGVSSGTIGSWQEPTDSWQRKLKASITATCQMCKHVISHMEDGGGGALVNMSSLLAVQTNTPDDSPIESGGLSYHVAKGAAEAYTIALAVEVGPLNIRVNCVRPGWIETPMTLAYEPRWSEVVKPYVTRRQAIKNVGQADDIANAAVFLASSQARFITGQVLAIDGGITLT